VLHDETEKRKAIEKLAEKYSPKQVEGRKTEIEKEFKLFHMVEIEVDHMTGKEAIELVKKQ